jgi:tetratricopeptide (TPR) repeat protein
MQSSDRIRSRRVHLDPPSPEAYQLYLHGLYYWDKRTESDVHESINYFQKAVAIDPQYALAYASLANAYVVLGSYGEPPWQVYPQAKATALKAVELDNTLAAAHASLAMVAMHYEWNWTDARKEFEQSIALNPNDSSVRVWYATHLAAMGHFDEAIAEGHRAEELDPLSPSVNTTVSRILYWNRDYDRAISGFDKVIEQYPNFAGAHIRCGVAFLAKHDPHDAILQFEEARRISGGGPYLDGLVGYAQALSGDSHSARETLNNLLRRSRIQYVPAFSVAMVYIGLAERESALEWLERAYQDHSSYMVYAKTDALLDPVRSEPRFSSLLNQMGLSQ